MSGFLSLGPRAHRRQLLAGAAALVLTVGMVGCSKDETPGTATTGTAAGSTTPGSQPLDMDAEARMAEASTIAVGFFEAQAVQDWDKALSRSTGAAALTIRWAQQVNTLTAANDSGYQEPLSSAPNLRVQIDALDKDGTGRWVAKGYVEESYPGPVPPTKPTAAPATMPGAPAPTEPLANPSTYIVDLVFSGDGDQLRLDDYRLDAVEYPMSQLYVETKGVDAEAGDLKGPVVLMHRNMDGAVQYIADIANDGTAPAIPDRATFVPQQDGSTKPGTEVKVTLFADPAETKARGRSLLVLPGAFPGSAGVLRLWYPPVAGAAERVLTWNVPEWPALTQRQINTLPVTPPTSAGATSTTTTSSPPTTPAPSTPTTAPAPSSSTVTTPTVPATTGAPITTAPSTSTTTSSTTTTSVP